MIIMFLISMPLDGATIAWSKPAASAFLNHLFSGRLSQKFMNGKKLQETFQFGSSSQFPVDLKLTQYDYPR